MLYKESLTEAENIFKALSAPMRLKIMELIYTEDMSINDLADALSLTASAVSIHVTKLVEAGLVTLETHPGKHGTVKIVKPAYSRMIIDMAPKAEEIHVYEDSIPVGHFSSITAYPTCGIASPESIIGEVDSPKSFSYPDRFNAGILWFGYGSVSYILPNRLLAGQTLRRLEISFEISSECPGYNEDFPSDIAFDINGMSLGKWISPGDFGARKGLISPDWWPRLFNQYGMLKTLVVSEEGTFIDGGQKISDVTLSDLNIDYNSSLTFTFSVSKDAVNCGGLTLFGEKFGDYNQNIVVKMFY